MFDFCDIFAILVHCDVWEEEQGRERFSFMHLYRETIWRYNRTLLNKNVGEMPILSKLTYNFKVIQIQIAVEFFKTS